MIEIWEVLKEHANKTKTAQFYAEWNKGCIVQCGWENKNVKTIAERTEFGISYEVHFKALDYHYKATLPPDCNNTRKWLLSVNKKAQNEYDKERGIVK